MIDHTISEEQLRQFVDQIISMEEEKDDVAGKITLLYADAKSEGFNTKAIKQIIKIMRMRPEDLSYQEAILEVYKKALGIS